MNRQSASGPELLRPHRRSAVHWHFWGRLLLLFWVLGPLTPLSHADVKSNPAEKPSKRDKEKKDKKGPGFLPEAADGSARFVAGKSVDIELAASVSTVKQVEFLIRQQPMAGTLSAVRPHPRDNNKAIVTYTHSGVDAALSDKFTFVCRVADGDFSSSATVTLTGQKYEPILSIQNVTAMRKVFLGGESSLRFTVRNIGPAAYAGDITWEGPWKGPPHIELQSNESAEMTVAFQPTSAGVFRMDRLLQAGHGESRLILYGECVRPLTASPGRLSLALDPKTGDRQGVLLLANGLSGPQKATLKLPPRLVADTAVEIPGSGQIKVTFSLPAKDFDAFKGQVIVSTADALEVVVVEAEAKPADLHVIKPVGGVLDLGVVAQGTEAHGEIVLKNTGGQPAVVQALGGGALRLTPADQAVRIAPGAEGIFAVTFKGDQVGSLQTEAHIQGAGQTLRVPVKADIIPAARSAPEPPTAVNAVSSSGTKSPMVEGATPVPESPRGSAPSLEVPPELRPVMLYLSARGMPVPKDRINPYLERIQTVEIRERSAHALTLAWHKPNTMPAGWSIETAGWTRLPNGGLVKDWIPVKNWETVKIDDQYVGARVTGLPASARLEFRLMGVDREGKVSEPSTFSMETGPAWHLSPWIWRGILSIALLGTLFALYRIREGYWDPEWPLMRRVLRL